MKCLVITLLILNSLCAFAVKDERQLLKCLGQEEKKFHQKKQLGPLYDLNQRLISEMIQIPHAEINAAYFSEICGSNSPSPALKLLELSIRQGPDVFAVPAEVTGSQRSMAQGMIDDYVESTKEIFLNFMTQIQTLAPTAACLKEEIPEIDAFFTDIKYLQEDVDMKAIFKGRDTKIFLKLLGYQEAFKKCQARIKKKPKSASKESPKKS